MALARKLRRARMDNGTALAALCGTATGEDCAGEVVVIIGGDAWTRGGLLRRLVAPAGAALILRGLDLQPGLAVGRQLMQALPVATADAAARARDCLAWVGLAGCFDALPGALSRGQQQRVVIARALLRQPRWLLCDDITHPGDVAMTEEVALALRTVAALGPAVLLATADLGLARRVADRVVFLHRGRVHEAGPAQRLFQAPATRELRRLLRC
jgi:polar amino acid transport system ATP-binding protein